MRALLGGWEAWLRSGGEVEEAGAMTKKADEQETQRVASPNPSADFKGKPPDGSASPSVRGTPGTAQGATGAGTPVKKAQKSRTKRRRGGT